jgi:hypothetical protein
MKVIQRIIDHQWNKIVDNEEYQYQNKIAKDTTASAFRCLFITVLHKLFHIPEEYLERK